MSFRSGLIRAGRTTHSWILRPGSAHNGLRGRKIFVPTINPRRHLGSLDVPILRRVEAFAHKLHSSAGTNQLAEIHKCYPVLVEDIKKVRSLHSDGPIPSPLNRQQLIDVLNALAASGRPFDLALVEKIISDMSAVFGLEPTTEDHTAIIRALLKHGNIQTTQRWLLSMPQKPGHISPSQEQWNLLLEYCYEQGELGSLRAAIKVMRRSGCRPTNASFKILIKASFESSPHVPHVNDFSAIMDDMMQEGLPYDHSVVTSLHSGYANHGHHQRAIQVERMYESRFTGVDRGKRKEVSKWNKRLGEESQKRGARAAVKLCKVFQQEGFVASHLSLTAILRTSASSNDLRYVEEELGMQASVAHWSILICNAVRSGDITGALSIYAQSQKSGIRPDAALVHPIIGALCQTAFKPPDEAAIDQALALYQDLVCASSLSHPDIPTSTKDTPSTFSTHSPGPDSNIYNALLRALSSSTNISKYYPLAMSLLDDMQSRNVSLENSMTTTSLTILLMRNSSSSSEAFDMYRRMCKSFTVDAKGYAVLLNAFCKLSCGDQGPLPSLHYYFEIVKDMRSAGHGMTAEVYTILLRQLASLATRMTWDKSLPENFGYDLVAAVRRAHNHLTVDASISPDTVVWNQLMDTYQRAGCFGEACRVWEMMYLSGSFDNTSVSIILDACGYAGAWPVVAQICMKLLKNGFSFNQRNWNAWLECLCRLGKLNEAVKMVCLEMGKHQDDVTPNEESIRILLNFATKTNQQHEVLSRIKRYLPDVWHTLPAELRESL